MARVLLRGPDGALVTRPVHLVPLLALLACSVPTAHSTGGDGGPGGSQADAASGSGDAPGAPHGPRVLALVGNPSGTGTAIDVVSVATPPPPPVTIDLHEVYGESLAVSPDGTRAYVAVQWAVLFVDLASGQVERTVLVPGAFDLAASPDGTTVWTTSSSGFVSIDTATGHITHTYPVMSPLGIAVSRDSLEVAVATNDSVQLLDVAQGTLSSIPLAAPAGAGCGVEATDPVFGDRLYVWDPNCNTFYQVDPVAGMQLAGRDLVFPRNDGVPESRNAATYSFATGKVYAAQYSGDLAIGDPATLSTHDLATGNTGALRTTSASPDGSSVFIGIADQSAGMIALSVARLDATTETLGADVLAMPDQTFVVRDLAVIP